MKNAEILVVEDDKLLNRMIVKLIEGMGHVVTGVNTLREARKYLEQHEPELIISDLRLPDGDCVEHLATFGEDRPLIVLTAYGTVKNAVTAMQAGVLDYLTKPVSPEELTLTVQRSLENLALKAEHHFNKVRLQPRSSMVGESPELERVRELVNIVADSDLTVLILGESGSGKELVAREIHDNSHRSNNNFVTVDCCTLQETLFESELFGHEKGAFTSADRQKKGLIEGAVGGTLFLDEIGEIPAAIQAKLLRVLETGKFRRVGGNRDLLSDVRIVAATNRNLKKMSEDGKFREDLYYRLESFTIVTPPLRDRREDIPLLVDHFIRNHSFSMRIQKSVTRDAMRKLIAYDWPGNIRELRNVLERAIILSRDRKTIRSHHLTFAGTSQKQAGLQLSIPVGVDPTLEAIEEAYLRVLLKKFAGHRASVAQVMGISERNVYRLIRKYRLSDGAETAKPRAAG